MLRVLHSVSNMDRAGIETMLMNYYRHMDREKIQFDFLANKPKKGDYEEEIKSMGGNIYLSPGLNPVHYAEYLKFTDEIIKNNPDIKIIHAHNEAMGLYALNGAKRAGIKVRIAHAHNTKIIKDYKYPLKLFCKQFLPFSATEFFGCGRDAGIYYFGKKRWQERGMIMRNAIDTEKFKFSEEARARIRKEYSAEGKNVIGHVGRFNVQKNHTRILEIFKAYLSINPSSVLFLIGEGELEEEMKEKAKRLQITDNIRFLGLKQNVEEFYSAMDVFLMPSLFEGLPVVGIEAQASGLLCLFSDAVTDEVLLSDKSLRISLKKSNEEWAEALNGLIDTKNDRSLGCENVISAGYDIKTEAEKMQNFYLEIVKK